MNKAEAEQSQEKSLKVIAEYIAIKLRDLTSEEWEVNYLSELWDFDFVVRNGDFKRRTSSLHWEEDKDKLFDRIDREIALIVSVWNRNNDNTSIDDPKL